MNKRVPLTGNDAGAEALKDVNPDVAAVFPITPQTELMHKFASYVHDGVVDTGADPGGIGAHAPEPVRGGVGPERGPSRPPRRRACC